MDTSMNIHEILKYLPHRYPFLLVDKVIDIKFMESIKAVKNISYNEPQFTGHFPQIPLMPGVLILEAMAQVTALLAFKSMEARGDLLTDDKVFYFAGIDKARFKRPVSPGDQLVIEAFMGKCRKDIYTSTAVATVDDQVVCTAQLMAAYKQVQK